MFESTSFSNLHYKLNLQNICEPSQHHIAPTGADPFKVCLSVLTASSTLGLNKEGVQLK